MLQPHALATLADLKRRYPMAGNTLDGALEDAISEASANVELEVARRIVFRAPTEDDDGIVASVAVPQVAGTTHLVAAGSPSTDGRVIVVTVTDPSRILLATGITVVLTITGTVAGVAGVTEVFDLCQGVSTLYGTKFFTAVSARDLVVTGTPAAGATIKVGTSLGYVDYSTPQTWRTSDLWLPEWPARQILSLHEDTNRIYDAASLLTEDTDFLISGDFAGRPRGILQRIGWSNSVGMISSNGLAYWRASYRAQRLVCSAGYFTVANVPATLKAIVLRAALTVYQREQHGALGITGESDATGNRTYYAPAGISDADREKLRGLTNYDRERVWERAFDLEAA